MVDMWVPVIKWRSAAAKPSFLEVSVVLVASSVIVILTQEIYYL
jgi:hypothetical protein